MASSFFARNFYNAYYRNESELYFKEVNKMTDTAKMAIKIASGVAIVVIAAVKIIKEKKNNKPEESPENEETTE